MHIINPETVGTMQLHKISGIDVFRPRLETESLIRREAERHLRCGYSCGTYSDPAKINAILQHQFEFFHRLLGERLPHLASRDCIEFLLHQYGETSRIEHQRKKGNLCGQDLEAWSRWGATMRRGVKYLAERVALLEPGEAPPSAEHALLQLIEECTIYAEQLVELYIESDQTFMLFPGETDLTIHPEGNDYYLDLKVRDFERFDIRPRIERDVQNQIRFIPSPPFQFDFQAHAAILDETFNQSFGFSWTEAMTALKHIIDTTVVPEMGFDIPFCRQDAVIDGMSKNIPGATLEKAGRFLQGFSLPVKMMQEEGREIWKPKQEYRALRRGFFEFPHPTGPHLAWSRVMARECLLMLTNGVVFQRVPPEWKSDEVNAGLAKLSNQAGKWFETVTEGNVAKVGIVGLKSLKSVGMGDKHIAIPADVGELDFLGYHSGWQLLVLLECKMVDGASEPRYMRDDISKFVTADKSYVMKFLRKVKWVRDNMKAVCFGLETVLPNVGPIAPAHLATAMVTLHPTLASVYINDLPCVSLTELMLDIEERGAWPYAKGLHAC